jgi:hypothetical protein
MPNKLKPHQIILLLLQFVATVVLVYYAGHLIWKNPNIPKVFQGQVSPVYLVLAGLCIFSTLLIAYIRWYFLMRLQGVPVKIMETIRWGFTAEFLGLISIGAAGVDMVKLWGMINKFPAYKGEIAASVVMDRVLGLLSLLLLVNTTVLVHPTLRHSLFHPSDADPQILTIFAIVIGGLVAIVLGLAVIYLVSRAHHLHELVQTIPKVGRIAQRMIVAVSLYIGKPVILLVAVMFGLGLHFLVALSMFLIGLGLQQQIPPLNMHFFISPVLTLTGLIPMPLSGLGASEVVLDFLFRWVSDQHIPAGVGAFICLGGRLISSLVVCSMGGILMLTHPRLLEYAKSILKKSEDNVETAVSSPLDNAELITETESASSQT